MAIQAKQVGWYNKYKQILSVYFTWYVLYTYIISCHSLVRKLFSYKLFQFKKI